MKKRLLQGSAFAALMFFALGAPDAFAVCTNNPPANNQTVTCSGFNNTTVNGGGATNVTLDIQAGASLTSAGSTATLGNGALVNIAAGGTLTSTGGAALTLNGGGTIDIASTGSLNGGSVGVTYAGGGGDTINITIGGQFFTATLGAANSNVTINTTTNGFNTIDAGAAGTDALVLTGTGSQTANTDNLLNFDTYTKNGTGTWILSGTNQQGWTVSAGILEGTTANLGNVSNSGTLRFTSGGTYTGDITGTGSFVKNGGATLILTGNNDFTGTTTVQNATTMQIQDAAALSATSGITVDFSTFQFGSSFTYDRNFTIGANDATFDTQAFNVTVSGDIGGATGRLVKGGTGALTLTGTNSWGDDTYLGAGTIIASADGNLGAGASDLIFDGGAFQYGAGFDTARGITLNAGGGTINTNGFNTTLSGVLTGAGAWTKSGTGMLTLTNTSNYTGATNVNAGTLKVSGSIATTSLLTINNGATVQGTGTLGDTSVASGGILAPGNSIGTINVTGDLTFNAGSHYAVEYSTTNADKTIATGNIVINNGAILDLTGTAGNYAASTDYTILQGASVTGTFGTINDNLPYIDPSLSISGGNALILTLIRNNTSFATILANPEKDFGAALDELANDMTTAFALLTTEQAQEAAEDLSNQHEGGITGFAATANTSVLTGVATRMGQSFGGGLDVIASAPSEDGVYTAAYLEPAAGGSFVRETNLWMKAIGTIGNSEASSTSPEQDRHSYGFVAGIDRAFVDKGFFGFFAGYERGEVETPTQGASSQINNYHAGAYATRPLNNGLNVSTGAAFTWHDIDTVRYIVFPGFQAAPESDTHGYSASAFVEISKPFKQDSFVWAPYANFTLAHTYVDGYNEKNGGLANLVVKDTSIYNPITVFGARFKKTVDVSEYTLNLNGSLGWQHTYGNISHQTGMRFETGAVQFESSGAPLARDSAVIALGVDARLGGSTSAFAAYNGTIGEDSKDHGFSAGLKIDF